MRYALVTGGSRGIGRAVSLKLAEMGFYIIVNYLSNEQEALSTLDLIHKNGGQAEILQFDVADNEQTVRVLSQWISEHDDGFIEVLINNAGIRKDNLIFWMENDDWTSVLGIGLNGFYNVTRPLLKGMMIKKFGRIINIVSLSGIKGMPGQVNYSAAKGGVIAATKALSQEVARKKITVNAIAPGFIRTDMTSELPEKELKSHIPMGRFGEAKEVADLVSFLASENASYITGEVISINGGLYT